MNRLNKLPARIFQAVLLIILALFLFSYFEGGSIHSNASFENVQQALAGAVDPGLYPLMDSQKLKRTMNIDPSSAVNVAFYRLDDAMSANELLLIEYDPAQKEELEAAARSRQASQEHIYEGYAPQQAALMKDALIDFEENYGLYYVGSDPQRVEDVFRAALRGNS